MRKRLLKKYNKKADHQLYAGIDPEAPAFMAEEEWEQFHAPALQVSELSEAFIQKVTAPLPKVRPFRRFIVAASLLAAAAALVGLLYNRDPSSPVEAYHREGRWVPSNMTFHSMYLKNTGSASQTVFLPDHSQVILTPGSEIAYSHSLLFEQKREVHLKGDALFKVAKNTCKPFTVYCGDVATTALGTIFRVTDRLKSGRVDVALLEGKIMVRSFGVKDTSAKYYLLPGNRIRYNTEKKLFVFMAVPENNDRGTASAVQSAEPSSGPGLVTAIPESRMPAPAVTVSSSLIFKNEPLAQVLDQLAHRYGVEIAYPTQKVAAINFIGTIKAGRSLKKILSDIALMNDLRLTIDSVQGKYILR
ncbi:hypothetical protein A8C56_06145 [Niabella ginsenosidivorans]|uniref:FecR protein domain-containing protein n=1 Tax=Niabella ginsenosidivorans TaxID=1176587 RepID=A0A1A9HYY5_9BACT|nr:FecR family protein [Niabella ginsenosidivorans]ANH80618.1 hypothetical protein A8C56_06145 [Niabella ginsenosidivorans]